MARREGNEVTDLLAERFESDRPHLRGVAYRMLGSLTEAEDAVQEAWLRLSRTDADARREPRRLADDRRRPRLPGHAAQPRESRARGAAGARCRSDRRADDGRRSRAGGACWPTRSGWRCWSCSRRSRPPSGWRSCCTTCSPCRSTRSRRSSDRSPTPRGSSPAGPAAGCAGATAADADPARQREVVDAFLAAARGGDFDALVAVLDPDVVLRADGGPTAGVLVRGAAQVAGRALLFAKFTRADIERVLVNGVAGLLARRKDGRPASLLAVTVVDGRIVEIDVLADAERLARLVD